VQANAHAAGPVGRRSGPRAARGLGWACAAASVLLSSFARAEPQSIRLSVRLEAPATCPGLDVLLSRTRARARITVEAPPRADRRFEVSIQTTPRGYVGQVREGGREAVPEIEAPTCDELVSALALTVALAVDPLASTAPEPNAPTQELPLPKATPVVPRIAAPREPIRSTRVRVDLGADLETGIVGPSIGAHGGVSAAFASWPPNLLARGHFVYARVVDGPDTARLDLFRLRGDLAYLVRKGSFALGPRVGFEVGLLHATGRALDAPESTTLPWFAPKLMGVAQVGGEQGWAVELSGGIAVPLARPVLSRGGPDGVVLEAGFVGACTELSIRFDLP
jgi:hypothetical protein